ncbi:ribonuclease H-like domain-containing protein [Rhizophagus irregularis DAOM 181602=DAOM 197198]|nr:ribonuclease H-like domain-containing protein [Rhizophagus irregularis DAOM 181602=DAOM 197198]
MIPDKPGLLKDRFMIVQRPVSLIAKELAPCIPPSGYKKNWIVTMSDNGLPSFGKQIQIQPKRSTCTIVHWTSDCLSRPSEFITLRPCSGCDLNINKSSYSKKSALLTPHLLTAGDVAASSSVVLSPDSQYTFYTDGSLINLVTSDRNIIYDWPSSSRAEAAAIYAALSASPVNSIVHIYTDSQSSIEGLKHCFLSDYSDSRLYYKTTNFELWAIIQQLIVDKQLSVLPFKVKAHSNFYWNDFADSLANTAHTSDDAILISRLDLATVHDYIMSYDDIVCESNPRHLFKQYHQMLYMKDLLALSRFHFISFLTDPSQYVVDWVLTWHTLMFQPKFDNSFTKENVSRHHTLKFQLFLEDLPTLESLKRTRSDLYVEILTCRSCEDHLEDFMHLFLCKKRRKQVIMPIVITLLQLIELLPSLAELFHQTTGLPIVLFVAVCLPPFWKFLKT